MHEKEAGKTNTETTVMVIGSQPLVRPDGRNAILLDTLELGPIAFEVNQKSIDGLRLAIGAAETHLRQSKDQTKLISAMNETPVSPSLISEFRFDTKSVARLSTFSTPRSMAKERHSASASQWRAPNFWHERKSSDFLEEIGG